MSARTGKYSCKNCLSQRNILFCTECTELSCKNCVDEILVDQWYCNHCKKETPGNICGTCGNKSKNIDQISKMACRTCRKSKLGEPDVLLNSLSSEFFATISSVLDIQSELTEVHRKFDFFVTLTRLCRLANLVGFPQIEEQLQKCAKGLETVNSRGIEQINRLRSEAMFDLRNINYFQDLDLMHYRNASAIIQATNDKIDQMNTMMIYWIGEINCELEKLLQIAEPLRNHYELLTKISRYMPYGVNNVVAVIPPINLSLKHEKGKIKDDSYLVFAEELLVCLPVSACEDQTGKKIINGYRYPYDVITNVKEEYSVIKGSKLTIETTLGDIHIATSPVIIAGIKDYFQMVFDNQSYVVGSSKDIIEIENNGPDKNKYKRSAQKLIDSFRLKMFGSPVQEPSIKDDLPIQSVSQIQQEYDKLLKKIREVDFLAKNLQIDPSSYQSHRNQFKENLEHIQDTLGTLGGHLMQNSFKGYRFPNDQNEYS